MPDSTRGGDGREVVERDVTSVPPAGDAAVAERYRLLLDLSPDAMAVHQDWKIVYVNSAALDFARVSSPHELLGHPITDFVHPDEIPRMIERLVGIGDETGATTSPEEMTMLDAAGVPRPMEVTSVRTLWLDEPAYLVILRDVISRKAIRSAAAEPAPAPLLDRLRILLGGLIQPVLVVGEDGGIELANPAAETMFGPRCAPGESIADLPLRFVDGESPVTHCLESRSAVTDATAEITTQAGRRWLSCSCRLIEDADAHPIAVVSFVDVTERYRERTRLAWDAVHDPLTQLYNRAGILDRLDAQIAELSADGDPACVTIYYIDLDSFQLVNDSLGHAVGDEVLHTVARRLAAVTPESGAVGRIGGDEFVLVAKHSTEDSASDIDRQIDAVRTAIDQPVPVSIRAQPLTIRASIGVATLDKGDTATPTDLLRDADIALGEARKASRVPYVHFRVQHREQLQRRQRIEEELRRALDSDTGQLEIHYQPIVSTASGALVALEALLRWNHPELGPISPTEFIPLAERSTLIDALGAHVLETASAEVGAIAELRPVMLSVNVSRRELDHGDFLDRLRRVVTRGPRPAESLCLEITESAIAPIDRDLLDLLAGIRALGVRISLDDFGTGASTLSELYRMPVEIMKTAKGFVDALREGPNARRILSGIVGVAHSVGVRVVAEGIETAEQAGIIAEVGCDYGQGFHYGRPLPLGEIMADGPLIATGPLVSEQT